MTNYPWMAEPYTILNLGEDIKVIVITGGPCSGKTTGIARLYRMLSDRGYKVLVSPETATKLITAGMLPGELPWPEFQEEILLDTLSQEPPTPPSPRGTGTRAARSSSSATAEPWTGKPISGQRNSAS